MAVAHHLWMYGLTISCVLYSFSEFKQKNAAKKTATKEHEPEKKRKVANKDSQQKSRKKAGED